MGDIPPHDDSDDIDDFAALEYSYDHGDAGESDLAALVDFVPAGRYDEDDDVDGDVDGAAFVATGSPDATGHPDSNGALYLVDGPDAEDDEAATLFTVTNPPGTVTVTTFLDGRVQQIELAPRVVDMTEADLADEIVVIAGLATMDARSAQFTFMLDGMRQHGHSDVATRDFLARDLDLPSPEQADARRAQVFATRYEGSHE